MSSTLDSVSILLVEDQVPLSRVLRLQLERAGHLCTPAFTLREARALLEANEYQVALLDIRLPDGNGLDFLAEVKQGDHPELAVVVLTSFASVEDAVQAIKLGAADYLTKPEGPGQTLVLVERALHAAQEAGRLHYARQRDHHALDGAQWMGDSEPARQVRAEIARLAEMGSEDTLLPTVLIQGETGAGKDLAARLIHLSSPRAQRPFVQVDCAALPEGLFEAELFGHEKGAFTQAHQSRCGLIEAAEDGTLFLDEIGEVPLDLQAKLLAVLDRRQVRRIGSTRERRVEARFLAATNRDLAALVARGRFRGDLYYRLKVLNLELPPLRERSEDVIPLAESFAAETSRRYGLQPPVLDQEARAALRSYGWPGNVRELKHMMERATLLHPGSPLAAATLGLGAGAARRTAPDDLGADLDLAQHEKALVEEAMRRAEGNVSQAARLLGLSRGALRNRLDRFGITG
ncbi:MAG: sigma-54-dependent Fis family transcriptional regulator [Planctomycetes bacterium]|nr:sigma-54-dependent Fis family transcriptional regulator [Planctomycetota bacterium]